VTLDAMIMRGFDAAGVWFTIGNKQMLIYNAFSWGCWQSSEDQRGGHGGA